MRGTRADELEPRLAPLLLRVALFALALGVVVLGLVTARWRDTALLVPVRGVSPEKLRDSFRDPRGGGRRHRGIDIRAPRGTPVVAADDGVVVGLGESPSGGLAVHQRDALGERCFFYGHLERYRAGLEEGHHVRRGETLAFVGSSGNASDDAPHLHFEVRLSDCSRAVNPYDFFFPS